MRTSDTPVFRRQLANIGLLGFTFLLSTTALAQRPSIAALQSQITTLQGQVVPNLGTYLTVDTSTPTQPVLRVAGANLQVVSGAGTTNGTVNGLGNVIIGYNETSLSSFPVCSDGSFTTQPTCLTPAVWAANQHTGSHNLVIGSGHSYTSFGGMVAGNENAINRVSASVTGGRANVASGQYASVSGGYLNAASGFYAGVLGGYQNTASGVQSTVSGGYTNGASGTYASMSGGQYNSAVGQYSSVLGGYSNNATANYSAVSGGQLNIASGPASSVSGGNGNTASGTSASVSGGTARSIGGTNQWAGGLLTSP